MIYIYSIFIVLLILGAAIGIPLWYMYDNKD